MYLNTQSGLTGALDTIGQLVAANQQNDAQMRGLSAAGVAGLTPADAPKGMLSGILGSLGIGGQSQGSASAVAPRQASLPATAPQQSLSLPPMTVPASAPTALPAFAAAGGGISPNAQQALAYFQDKGLSPVAAQGLVGGFMRESGGKLDPNAVNPTGGATGIAQWLGSRAQGLQQFAANAGRSPNDLRTQLDYAWSELSGPERAALGALQKASNPLQATVAALGFERPEGWSAGNPLGAKDFGKRLAATVGLGGTPGGAMAFAPQGGAAATPGAQAIASAAAGGSPAQSDGAGASALAPNIDQIRALIQNPATRDFGLQLWKQAISPKDGYTLKQGESRFDARNNLVAGIPAAPIATKANETLVDPITHQPIYTAPGKDLDLKQIGEDQYGNKQFGIIDKTTGQVTPVAAPAGASGAPAGDPNLHGKDYLATLNPQIAAQVQAYAEGRVKLPTGQGANSPFARQVRAAVLQYDPNFDATNTDARFKTRLDFSPGAGPNSAGVAIQAGNTAIQHLGELSDAAEELHNSRLPIVNSITQGIGSATGGNIPGTKFQTALQNYTDEITKFYRGTGGTESEIQARMKSLSPTMSPDQLKTAIATEVDLLQGKINALQDRWHQGMGPTAGDFPIVQPKSQAALDRIAARVATPASGAPVTPAGSSAPAPVAQPPIPGARQAPDGKFYVPDPARPGKYLQVQ